MKGTVQVKIWNNRVQYKFTIKRNITILYGNSATGKTTLIDMIAEYENNNDSGISLQCEKECVVIEGRYWKDNLQKTKDSIVFIDEGSEFITSKEFAEEVRKSDNYYVIATRNPLPMLPYSVDEIYGITNKTRGYGRVKRLYSEFQRIYTPFDTIKKPDLVITEDSNAGFQFFLEYFSSLNIPCISAKGKANIMKTVMKFSDSQTVLIIADGAAFGSEMEKANQLKYSKEIILYLPESFEWIILSSELFNKGQISDILRDPSEYIESENYFSWERFFTTLLTDTAKDTYLSYNKRKLNPAYLQKHESNEIINVTPLSEIPE